MDGPVCQTDNMLAKNSTRSLIAILSNLKFYSKCIVCTQGTHGRVLINALD